MQTAVATEFFVDAAGDECKRLIKFSFLCSFCVALIWLCVHHMEVVTGLLDLPRFRMIGITQTNTLYEMKR